jgi:thiamine-phosphate pyrophosphorylase
LAPQRTPPFRLLAISQLFSPSTPAPASAATAAAGAWFAALAAAGVDAMQLREKGLDDRSLLALAKAARATLPATARLLVNGRADIALASGADGAHLPADGLPAARLRARLGAGPLLGVSTHDLAEVEQAARDGADYVVFGPVWDTPGKPAARQPAGLAALARAAAVGIPAYALGGVTLERFADVAATGAAGVAAIRLFRTETALEQIVEAAHAAFPRPWREQN